MIGDLVQGHQIDTVNGGCLCCPNRKKRHKPKIEVAEPEACPICLLPHDPEIHDATGRIRRWLRDDIEGRLNPPDLRTKFPNVASDSNRKS